ncbi:MAG TPA: accessory factor UbiK family protein [Rhodospirillales bacterium]|jgi:BMFP domain-containing protein YqiC|nr:accessory factor UbiK family protein [Rhodospirillales bacterium]MDP7601649.1 accessory factor UbiK family protein [Rhodospirillales bacterium]MDP7623680.1 accessory factor UbiK family protein [Rhodospirillales bacterium]HJO85390.1 accessory factor UbiK family protein [Rhodospirillales bacterium]
MQTRNRFFDDLAKVANSAAGTVAGMKEEVEQLVRNRVESFIDGMNLVTREEFEVARAMAAKARDEQEKLEKRIVELEAKLGTQKTKSSRKKAAPKKSSTTGKAKKS